MGNRILGAIGAGLSGVGQGIDRRKDAQLLSQFVAATFGGLGPQGQQFAEAFQRDPQRAFAAVQSVGGLQGFASILQQQQKLAAGAQQQQFQNRLATEAGQRAEEGLDIRRGEAGAAQQAAEAKAQQAVITEARAAEDQRLQVEKAARDVAKAANQRIQVRHADGTIELVRPGEELPTDLVLGAPTAQLGPGDVGITSRTQGDIEKQLVSLDSLSAGISDLRQKVKKAGGESFGVRGFFGELFIDGLAAQLQPELFNAERRELRQTARINVQQQLRNISQDQRFTEKERAAVKEIIASLLDPLTSKPQVEVDLATLDTIIKAAQARVAGAPKRVTAQLAGAEDPLVAAGLIEP